MAGHIARPAHRIRALTLTIIIATLGLAPAHAAAQAGGDYTDIREWPKSPGVERVQKLIEVLNAANDAAITDFVKENFAPDFLNAFPMDAHLGAFQQFTSTGPVEFYGVRKYAIPRDDSRLVVIVRRPKIDTWRAIVVELQKELPHKIAALTFAPARPPKEEMGKGEPIAAQALPGEIEKLMKRLADADVFSGTVLVARNGQVVYEGACGLASRAFTVPNRIDTRFRLGSMNKMFTAVACAQLVEQGKLSYDDPLSKYVDESWLPKSVTERVQIKHLLSHTSGLGSYFNERFRNTPRDDLRNLDDFKPLVQGDTLAFEPGTRSQYSNTGFLLLGVVIEKASGENYFDYVRAHIYKPAGMNASDSFDMDVDTPNLAIGYSKYPPRAEGGPPVYRNNLFTHPVRGGPAGGGFSTVRDLLAFDQALRSGKLLKPESTQTLWTPHPDWGSPTYGYGFGVFDLPIGHTVGHSGGFTGMSANLEMCLDTGWTIAVLSNYDEGAPLATEKIHDLLMRVERPE